MKPTRWARIHDCGDDLRHHLAAWDRAGFARLLRAEFTKFRTVRSWMIALCAAAVVFVLLSFVSAFASRAPVSAVPTGPGGEAVSDTYMFVHQALAGDGTLTARVAVAFGSVHLAFARLGQRLRSSHRRVSRDSQLQPGLAPWAKAGIILEPDTNQGTAYAAVMVTGSHGVQMQYNYTHDSPGLTGAVGPSSPRWLRLTRVGDVITGYDSTDGDPLDRDRHRPPSRPSPHGPDRAVRHLPGVLRCRGQQLGLPALPPRASTRSPPKVTFPAAPGLGDAIAGLYPVASASTWQQRSAGAFTITGSGDIAPLVGDIISAQWSGASIVNGTIVALLHRDRARHLVRYLRVPPRADPHHLRRQPAPRPCPGRQGRHRRIAGLRRRSHRDRDRRSDHPPRPGRQRELSLPAKRACPGPGHHRHRALPGARRGTGRCAGHDAAAQRRDGRCRHRAPRAAGHSRLCNPGTG